VLDNSKIKTITDKDKNITRQAAYKMEVEQYNIILISSKQEPMTGKQF
jgi:hypothetical protein